MTEHSSADDYSEGSDVHSQSHGDESDGSFSDEPDDDTSSVEADQSTAATSASWWVQKVALLGDSSHALIASFLLVVLAVGFSWHLQRQDSLSPEEIAYRKLGAVPRPAGPALVYEINPQFAVVDQITKAMKESYHRDGVLAFRGLIPPSFLQDMQQAADELIREQHYTNAQKRFKVRGKQFFTVHHGAIFRTPESLQNQTHHSDDDADDNRVAADPMGNPFLRVMVQTSLSQVAATLLHHTMVSGSSHSKENLRILRDIFLAKDDDPFVCGWHVDDHGFWPALSDAPGINLWIALDDYNDTASAANDRVDPGGGFALAVGSHAAPWRHEAYHVTGAAPTVPEGGFSSAMDMVHRRVGSGTCNIAHAAPHLQRRMEETKRIYRDLRAGDVIFHDRWLFHRTIPQNGTSSKIKRRYSVRLGPGSSTIPPGYGTEPSVLHREENGGKTADEVSHTWPFYPKVYPSAVDTELDSWREFCDSVYPAAMELQEARKREMKPHLQRLAQRQQIHPQANNRLFDFSEGYA